MKKFIIVIILIYPYLIKSQNITRNISTIEVEISATDISDSSKVFSLCSELIHVRQIFYLQNKKNDTLHFYLEHPSVWAALNSQLFFQKMEVNFIIGKEKEDLPFLFPGTELSFCAPEENCTVEIGYYYMMPFYNLSTPYSFLSYQWDSWYFSVPEMTITEISFLVPEHTYLFSNILLSGDRNHGKPNLAEGRTTVKDITFFIAEKRFYTKKSFVTDNQTVNLYLFKGEIETDDSTSIETWVIPNNRVTEKSINNLQQMVTTVFEKVSSIFGEKKKTINIVDSYTGIENEDGVVHWGEGFFINDTLGLIVMDTSYWNNHTWIHELIHLYNVVLPNKEDSAYYFFNESMTEYLSIFIKYGDNNKSFDAIYKSKIRKYKRQKKEFKSIFYLSDNYSDTKLGGTYGIVYLKTPYIIYKFAKMVGGNEHFVQLFSLFYQQVEQKKTISLKDLEIFLKSQSVTDKQWDWFVKKL